MTRKARTTLTIGGYLKLGEWWKAHHARLAAERRTYVYAANQASADLGFAVNSYNCTRIGTEMNMPLESPFSLHGRAVKARSNMDGLARRVDELEGIVGFLAAGVKVPPSLLESIGSRNTHFSNQQREHQPEPAG